MSVIVSIIIPTHNRSASLKKMLKSLQLQSYPQQNFEVIIAADGCKDDTVETIKNYSAPFQILLCELPGLGAASARNKGASVATGKYLIFVDDDMELSTNFIQEHIALHRSENDVVIGYSPLMLEQKPTIQRLVLREWWEEKFQAMRHERHRFKYDDLTSGNFSISNLLFQKVEGFDTTLLCREDYELGFRLIEAGAQFHFAYKAKASHCDEVTNIKRSLQRKKSEGIADMQIKTKHPAFINKEALYLTHRSFVKSVLLASIQYTPSLTDAVAKFGFGILNYLERLKMLSRWQHLNYRLLQYWYLKGLITSTGSAKKLYQLINQSNRQDNEKIKIDLKSGLNETEKQLDQARPQSLEIFYGSEFIGILSYEAGSEPIKGLHLRKILKDNFSDQLSKVLMPDIFVSNDK